MPKLRIFNWSDIHLELTRFENIKYAFTNISLDPSLINVLVLTGDILTPKAKDARLFLKFISNTFDYVFYTLGNHEYYTLDPKSYLQIKAEIQSLVDEYHNIHLLDNQTFELEGFKFIGCTLWSHIPASSTKMVKSLMNDYNMIYKSENHYLTNITISDINFWNEFDVRWLENELDTNMPCIVLTHHAPFLSDVELGIYNADPKYYDSEIRDAFQNDLKHLIKDPVKVWCYGHTHWCSKYEINGVIVWTNQLGYMHERKKFNSDDYIDLQN